MHAAAANPADVAPAVIAAATAMAAGRLPLPPEERLLRFGLHALAMGREPSACPAFLALLRRPVLEVEWLFGEDLERAVSRLLLSLFDGDVDAVSAVVADAEVAEDASSGLILGLAGLVRAGRADRAKVLEVLDRFDREAPVAADSVAWIGWQEAVLHLGLVDWIDRVQRGWAAGRLSDDFRDVDRQDWIERTRKAAENPDEVATPLAPIDDPQDVEWSADRPTGPGEAPSGDELAWLDAALLRTVPAKNLCLEEADGLLTALAAGPVRVPASEYIAEILLAEGETAALDSAEHKALVVDLLTRHHDATERDLASGKAPRPWIYGGVSDLRGVLWARGYLHGIALRPAEWEPLKHERQRTSALIAPMIMLMPDSRQGGASALTPDRRATLLGALPEIALATKAHWQGRWHPLFNAAAQRAPKVGRNDPCPCGSGKKYKRCCGAVAA